MGAQRPVVAAPQKGRQWGGNSLAVPDIREDSTSTAMSNGSMDRDPSAEDPRPAVSNAAISSINKRLADILDRKNKRDGV